ncbi:TonB-dependent receptor [Marinimicrobium alkaliphilum]|uniref:TonB-dependent receptor n=1 Tax=Marinimicrobium alkaliphilum TaxID=2202654 RepID=UPI001E590FF1|nr:TonB-dependent receptor [Marinimicrobium alkaliphilum]
MMFRKNLLSTSIALTAVLGANQVVAQQQEGAILEEVVVTGIRSTLNQAIDIKRDSMQVMESIVAEDIGKLPDNNVVESLQRVAGVQVTDRGAGETNSVLVRGLPDVSTTINGRTVFTSAGRSVALADIPSTLVSRIDVSKSRSARHYENGIAGQIDVRTFRPFDFDGQRVSLAGRFVHQEQAGETDPIFSALFSDRWITNAGEFGALINVSHAKTSYRDQTITVGAQVPFMSENPVGPYGALERIFPDNDAVDESPIWEPGLDRGLPTAPGSTLPINGEPAEYYLSRDAYIMSDFTGERERPGANIALQFAPDDRSEYTFEAFYSGYRNNSFNALHFSFVDAWWDLAGIADDITDTFELYEDSNVIRSRTVRDNFSFVSGDYTDEKTDSYLFALGGEWDLTDNFTLNSELVYQESDFESEFFAMRTETPRYETSVDFDGAGGISFANNPATDVDESDLTDPSQFAMAAVYDNAARESGSAFTFTTDGELWTENPFFHTVNFGIRWDERDATVHSREQVADGLCTDFAANADDCAFADIEGLHHINSGFMSGVADVPRSWVTADASYLADNREHFLGVYDLDVNDPMLREFRIDERNAAAYVTTNFEFTLGDRMLDGELGLRYVDVQTDTAFDDQETGDVVFGTTETSELLPSAMFRYHLSDELMLRLAYSETLRMPAFGDLNPTIRYFDDISGVGYGTAAGGNPDLQPTTSENIDLSLEWYFGNASYAYATLFERRVDGLVIPFRNSIQADIDGQSADTYIVSQPENASNGKLQGLELGFTYFPENLPGAWDGLGVITSATFLDSEQDIPVLDDAGEQVDTDTSPFFGVSDSSYSITAAYERPRFDARLSYIWRDDALNRYEAAQFANPLSIYRGAEESLDMQLSYSVTDDLVVTFDATNLTESTTRERYGNSPLHSHNTFLYSRTFALGARYSF